MSRELGELEYDEAAALRPGPGRDFPVGGGAPTEFCILTPPDSGDDEDEAENDERPDKVLHEARYIASRIRRMVDERTPVTEDKTLRPCTYGDFAILLRSNKAVTPRYRAALAEQGIPSVSQQGGGFFRSTEITSLLALLGVIDNPHQDVPLIAVLRSPLFGFTPDELSAIRAADRNSDYYTALCLRAKEDEHCAAFLAELESYREIAPDLSIEALLARICDKAGVFALLAAMPDGAARRENVCQLIEFARQFEQDGYRGVFRFIRWMKQLDEHGKEPRTGALESRNAVQIISIHHSKGLEYPIVFLADTAHKINLQDRNSDVLIHPSLGIGGRVIDSSRGISYPTIALRAISAKLTQESLSEEMRVLYVAMTRPQYRLIMTCCAARLTRRLESYAQGLSLPPDAALLEGADSLGDWILLAAMTRPEAGELFAAAGQPDCALQGGHPWRIRLHTALQAAPEAGAAALAEPAREQPPEPRFLPPYAHAAAVTMPTKLTATQLKGRELDNEAAEQTAQAPKLHFPVPRFEEGRRALTAAERGTALHLAMQHLNYAACADESGLRSELERLGRQKFLTPQQLEAVDPERLRRFFASPLGLRVLQAPQVVREFKFSVLDDGAYYDPELAGEEILLQGVTDCCLVELDGLVILDFKSDRLRPGAERERAEYYRGQLDAYSRALSRIFELPVSERIVYFFATDTAVSL